MEILVISCSGKRNGNSEKLAAAFSEGAHEAGHAVKVIRQSEIAIGGCRGCNACVETDRCVQRDGMQEVYPAFVECDAVVFVAPLYFWGMPAQMKAVIDRLYALGHDNEKGYYAYPKKKCGLIASAADTERHFWVFESFVQYWQRYVNYMRWEDLGTLLVGSCGGTKQPRRVEKTDGLARAHDFGASFGRQPESAEAQFELIA